MSFICRLLDRLSRQPGYASNAYLITYQTEIAPLSTDSD